MKNMDFEKTASQRLIIEEQVLSRFVGLGKPRQLA